MQNLYVLYNVYIAKKLSMFFDAKYDEKSKLKKKKNQHR